MSWFTAIALTVLALVLAIHLLDHGNATLRLLDRNVYLQLRILDLPGCVLEREA